MSDTEHLDRRSFVKVILTSVGGFITLVLGIPAIAYVITPATKVQKKEDWISAGPMEKYETENPTLFTFTQTIQNGWERTVNSYGVYIIKHSEEIATVFSNVCTHLSCRVTWKTEKEEFICPCHDGIFDKQGAVVSGPPPDPMVSYETKVEEGILYFLFKES